MYEKSCREEGFCIVYRVDNRKMLYFFFVAVKPFDWIYVISI